MSSGLVFLIMKIKKNTHSMRKKNAFKKHVDLFLEQEKQKKHYDIITDVNPFMYDYFLYHERLHMIDSKVMKKNKVPIYDLY